MNIAKFSLLFLICLFSFFKTKISAQEISVPKCYLLYEISDYNLYKDTVIAISQWLIKTPLFEYPQIRQNANKFIFKWVSGSSDFHLNIHTQLIQPIFKHTDIPYVMDIFMNYIAGMILAKTVDNCFNEIKIQTAGIDAMLKGYASIRNLYQIDYLEKLIKKQKRGNIEKWVRRELKL